MLQEPPESLGESKPTQTALQPDLTHVYNGAGEWVPAVISQESRGEMTILGWICAADGAGEGP